MSLQKLIDDKLLQEYEKKQNRVRSGKWKPSNFGRCFLYQYWDRQNKPYSDKFDARTLRVFKAGQLFHDFGQQFLPEGQVEVEIETDDVKGFADYVSEDAVYDIKSQHSRSFWYMEKTDYDINKEKLGNILQVCYYAWRLNKKNGVLVFISKDDLCVAEYIFPVDKWVGKINEELNTLRGFWNSKIEPKKCGRAYGKDKKTGISNECAKYCPYRTVCGGEK